MLRKFKKLSRIYLTLYIRQTLKFLLKRVILVIFPLSFLFIISLPPDKPEIFFEVKDHSVKTHSYLSEYKEISTLHKRFESRKFKTVLNNQRRTDTSHLTSLNFLVLEYDKIFGQTKYCQYFKKTENNYEKGKQKVYLDECPYRNCIFTCNHSLINDANAILFSGPDLENVKFSKQELYENLMSSIIDRPSQIWIVWNDEANKVSDELDIFKFNWTMSYRLESEISDCSYGCKYPKIGEIINPVEFKKEISYQFKSRNNTAVWFVSNCDSNYRLKFASNLKNYYPIEVYGSCSKYVQSGFFESLFDYFKPKKCGRDTECEYEKLIANKFYLSFESKNCSNYMTEKVWKMLYLGIIPVVIQPNRQFYELSLPQNSFIHAQDFDYDPKKLADYLTYVSSDFEMYYSYLKWKLDYDVVFTGYQNEKRRLCELCTKLNTENSIIYYNKVSDFFNDQCIIN
ncbi:unnamed protein product [Brachionus calyciflorus]|uniref:Fucosyltransferase n=1 Tax=Brachionus calyciflorus TaxID=104777 RepID=A0A814HZ72_9BILA|nr:unnamed protein product [Brachionus calyciflorus]